MLGIFPYGFGKIKEALVSIPIGSGAIPEWEVVFTRRGLCDAGFQKHMICRIGNETEDGNQWPGPGGIAYKNDPVPVLTGWKNALDPRPAGRKPCYSRNQRSQRPALPLGQWRYGKDHDPVNFFRQITKRAGTVPALFVWGS